jgi:hypothetical protein
MLNKASLPSLAIYVSSSLLHVDTPKEVVVFKICNTTEEDEEEERVMLS